MEYKVIESKYDEKSERTYIAVEIKTSFFNKKVVDFVDSTYHFTTSKKTCFYTYPDLEIVNNGDPLANFLHEYSNESMDSVDNISGGLVCGIRCRTVFCRPACFLRLISRCGPAEKATLVRP